MGLKRRPWHCWSVHPEDSQCCTSPLHRWALCIWVFLTSFLGWRWSVSTFRLVVPAERSDDFLCCYMNTLCEIFHFQLTTELESSLRKSQCFCPCQSDGGCLTMPWWSHWLAWTWNQPSTPLAGLGGLSRGCFFSSSTRLHARREASKSDLEYTIVSSDMSSLCHDIHYKIKRFCKHNNISTSKS